MEDAAMEDAAMDDVVMPTESIGTLQEPAAELSPEQQDRRRRLIDAAFELGAEGGYEAVQMRSVSETANVAMATIYRYFSSKDHLLAAAMTEWTGRLRGRVAQSPPRGATPADQMVDVLQRACKAMERQPKLAEALVRALSSADAGVRESGVEVSRHIAEMGNDILVDLSPQVRADILAVLGHVWYSALVSWANGRRDFPSVMTELERASRVLIEPYERELRAGRRNGKSAKK
jgi:AcrR family transcriptional regulator